MRKSTLPRYWSCKPLKRPPIPKPFFAIRLESRVLGWSRRTRLRTLNEHRSSLGAQLDYWKETFRSKPSGQPSFHCYTASISRHHSPKLEYRFRLEQAVGRSTSCLPMITPATD